MSQPHADGYEPLRKVRENKKNQRLRLEAGTKKKRIENIRQQISQSKEDLIEEAAPSEIKLKRLRVDGYVYLAVTLGLCYGMFYLVRLSLQAFLPASQISQTVQRTLALVFALGTIVTIHFSFSISDDGSPMIPTKLKVFAAGSFVVGLVFFSIVRGQLVGVSSADLAGLKFAEFYAKLLGAFAFVALGVGLDLGSGISGAFSWADLSRSLPLLRIYARIKRLVKEASTLEERVTAIEFLLPKVPFPITMSSNPHPVDSARTASAERVAEEG